MHLRLLLALLIVPGMLAFTPAPFPKPGRRSGQTALNLDSLQGTWKVEKAERTSNDGSYRVVADPVTHILVEKDIWVFMQGKGRRSNEYRIVVDASKKPVWFTFRGKTQAAGGTDGLMTRVGERVKVLYQWGQPRAQSFEKPPGEYWALTLIREK
jgi:uncharacterized protein (TIGR03067 family)